MKRAGVISHEGTWMWGTPSPKNLKDIITIFCRMNNQNENLGTGFGERRRGGEGKKRPRGRGGRGGEKDEILMAEKLRSERLIS